MAYTSSSPGVSGSSSAAMPSLLRRSQVGVSVHAVTNWGSAAIDWRLFLPASWDGDMAADAAAVEQIARRRARCKIPGRRAAPGEMAAGVDMLDEITGAQAGGCWGLSAKPVVTDAGYGDNTTFRLGLHARGLPYVAAVRGTTSAYPASAAPQSLPYAGRGRPPVPRYRGQPASLRELVLGAGRKSCRQVTWRHGSKRAPANRTAAMRSTALGSVRPTAKSPANPMAACPNAG